MQSVAVCIFISKFLNDRCFRVRVGSCFSDLYDQGKGVPQGAFICDFVYIENKQHYQMLASWRQRFTVRRRFLCMFSFEKFDSNRTSDTALPQSNVRYSAASMVSKSGRTRTGSNSHSRKQCACIFRSFARQTSTLI